MRAPTHLFAVIPFDKHQLTHPLYYLSLLLRKRMNRTYMYGSAELQLDASEWQRV